jgi:hypothetical protein
MLKVWKGDIREKYKSRRGGTFKILSWINMKINNDTYVKLSLLIQENLREWVRKEVKTQINYGT